MGTLAQELQFGCLKDIPPEEPIFVLRAQDAFAPMLIQQWINQARIASVHPEKIRMAEDCIERMRFWPKKKIPD